MNLENKAYIEAVKPSGFVRVFGKAVKIMLFPSFIISDVIAVMQTSRSCGTAGLAVIDSGGPSSIVKSPNIRCFVAKSGLSQFTRFLGVRFSAFDSNKYYQIGQ